MTDQEKLIVVCIDLIQLAEELKLAYDNKFSSMEAAETAIYSKLEARANEDCEGSYKCGSAQYIQQFYANDVLYEGVLDVEYNRHDKTYYYVEETYFKVRKVEQT